MKNPEKQEVLNALSYVIEPDLKSDIVALDLVSDLQISDQKISFTLKVNNPALHNKKRITEACEHQLKRFLGDLQVSINIVPLGSTKERTAEQRKVMPGVRQIIAVASGKGGVGKSTLTANLAAGFAQKGFKVGLIDADIYGPSIPMMFDVLDQKPAIKEIDGKQMMVPVENYGVKIMSIGFFADINKAVIWRGPMASKALKQMFSDVFWGDLDMVFIDLPPGTGDIHLTLLQSSPITGAIVVSTPQAVALADARKGINMFEHPNLKIPIIGLVENMSWFTPEELPDNRYYLFGKDGVVHLSKELKIKMLGQIPLMTSVRESADCGRPAVLQEQTSISAVYKELIQNVEESLALSPV